MAGRYRLNWKQVAFDVCGGTAIAVAIVGIIALAAPTPSPTLAPTPDAAITTTPAETALTIEDITPAMIDYYQWALLAAASDIPIDQFSERTQEDVAYARNEMTDEERVQLFDALETLRYPVIMFDLRVPQGSV